MFNQTTKLVQRVQPKAITEVRLNQTPDFYKSMANDATISKFKNQEVNEDFPFIVEYMEGSVVLNASGKNSDVIPFKRQVHDNPPIIEGMLFQPDMPSANILPIQTYWSDGLTLFPLFSGIGEITKNNFTFNIQTYSELVGASYTYPYAGQQVKYKLWILRQNI